MKKIKLNKNFYLISYKLLHDALFLALASFSAMLIGEGLLPGFVSARLSFSKVIIAIVIILASIAWLGRKLEIVYDAPIIKKNKLLPALILFGFLLIGNSLLKFELWANLIITLTSLVIFFLLYKEIFEEK